MTSAKKTIISTLAIASILVAMYSVWHWSKKVENQPVRQLQEIR